MELATSPLSFAVQHTSGSGRAGTLHTPHGSVETPVFMAVGTQGALKGITVAQAEDCDQGILLGNTYHLALRPGEKTVHELGGLHRFTGWQGPMLTDSGGYQVFSLASQRKITEEGVAFRSHIDGSPIHLTPEYSIEIQRYLGADIIMAFDECPAHDMSTAEMRASCERTIRWLDRCISAWQTPDLPRGAPLQALFGIVQGGLDEALRHWSLRETVARPLPGYAIGGLSVGESADERNTVLDYIANELPHEKPRYLMGVGTPLDIVEAVWRGVDCFDCVLPTRMGRHGIAYTDAGPMHMKRAQYASDPNPIDANTPSPASRHSRGLIRHLLKAGEALGGQLVSLHNLAYYQQLMARLRASILADELDDFVQHFRKRWQKSADS